MIRKELLEKFKKLYQDKYNISLNDEEATELAQQFLCLMEILIQPKPTPIVTGETNKKPEQWETYEIK